MIVLLMLTLLFCFSSCSSNERLLLRGENETWEVRIIDDDLALEYKGNNLNYKDSIEFSITSNNSNEVLKAAKRSLREDNTIKTGISVGEKYIKDTPWIITIKWKGNIETIEIKDI